MAEHFKKRIKIFLFVLIMVMFGIPYIATLISQARYELTKPPPLLRETDDTTPIHVVIGENELWIPANYFQFGYDERDKKEQVAAIRTYWPDMTGATKATIERRRKELGHLNHISMVIHRVIKDETIGRKNIYNFWLNNKYEKYKEVKQVYGLFYHENDFDPKIDKKSSMSAVKDIYVDNPNKPETLIRCISINVPEYEIPYPNCEQLFDYKQLSFSVNYSLDYLPYWKEIQEKVKQLIDQFSKKPN